jgi:hypothetical protein
VLKVLEIDASICPTDASEPFKLVRVTTITWFRRIAHLFCALLDMASLRFLYKFGLVRGHLKTDASICRCFTQNTFQPLPAFPRLSRNWIFPRPRAVAERGPSQQQPLHNSLVPELLWYPPGQIVLSSTSLMRRWPSWLDTPRS